jgi:adenylate cyclase
MRVQRTFAFLDLSGFTALTATRGDERAVDVLIGFRATVRQVCSRRAVRVAKWLGDGAMLVGVEARPTLETVLEVQYRIKASDSPVALRTGITTGAVILLEGDDYIGHSVNVAARLCDMAGANEILALPDLCPHLPAWATVLADGSAAIKGLDEPVSVVRLGLPEPGPDWLADPVCGLPLTPALAWATRPGEAGSPLSFCGESCLETWEARKPLAGAEPVGLA